MVNRWPDDALFDGFVRELIGRARANDHRVRALVRWLHCFGQEGMLGRLRDLNFSGNKYPGAGILSILPISQG
jgi:hypothetical protein